MSAFSLNDGLFISITPRGIYHTIQDTLILLHNMPKLKLITGFDKTEAIPVGTLEKLIQDLSESRKIH